MKTIHTVKLEFLRHGPPHNQLLSPLTEYLGLCGNNEASTMHVPYEHHDFLRRHNELRYKGGKNFEDVEEIKRRKGVLNETAVEIGKIMGSIPGFIAELGKARSRDNALTHIKVVLSAHELALLPFELAKTPKGCLGGGDEYLSLQSNARICITRQSRTVSQGFNRWSRKPKILFIAASPGGLKIPINQHLQVLYEAILPWVGYLAGNDDAEKKAALKKEVDQILTFLPEASIDQIIKTCSSESFTHVHILAHGMPDNKVPGLPYGLALHCNENPSDIEIVNGARLVSALCGRSAAESSADPLCSPDELPAVATIASCDSGNPGDVVYTGASFAHDLHLSGIPMVIASQFPLSFKGSVFMTEFAYKNLLWGEDPRCMLYHLRNQLHAMNKVSIHDWASLVVYESLPFNIDDQLKDFRYIQSKKSIEKTLGPIDEIIDNPNHNIAKTLKEDGNVDVIVTTLMKKVDKAVKYMPTTEEYKTEGPGMLGSAEKRKAHVYYQANKNEKINDKMKEEYHRKSIEALTNALGHYEKAFRENIMESNYTVRKKGSLHWVLTQYLSLRAILKKGFIVSMWHAAFVSADMDLKDQAAETKVYAHGSLGELYLILFAYKEKWLPTISDDRGQIRITHEMARERVLFHASNVAGSVNTLQDPFPVESTKRQFTRYKQWWCANDFNKSLQKSQLLPSANKLEIPGTTKMKPVVEKALEFFSK